MRLRLARRWAGLAERAGILALAGMAALPAAASAHTLSGKVDTPLPFIAYIAGAAAAVALSFVFVAISDPGPPRDPTPTASRAVPRWLRLLVRTVGLLGWLWILAQTIAGGNSDADVASLFLWTYGWVGLAVISALIGPLWSWLDPFSTLHDIGSWALDRLGIDGLEPQPYPERLGIWPAILGFGFYVWVELVAHIISGRLLGVVLIGYTIFTLIAMAQYGKDAWRQHGETFSVWFGLLGRLAPFSLVGPPEEGRVHRRPFASGLASETWTKDRVVLVGMGIAAILYDGGSQTQTFYNLFGFPNNISGTVLLIGFFMIIVALVLTVGRLVGIGAIGAGLVPVALGYLVAHYFTAFVIDSQRIVIAVSDPLQQGWDIFGTAFYVAGASWLATGVVWGIQVAAVVLGHVVGAWSGHAAARGEAGPESRHARSQIPLAVLMIVLTSATLWSLGQNLVFSSGASAAAGTSQPAATPGAAATAGPAATPGPAAVLGRLAVATGSAPAPAGNANGERRGGTTVD